MQADYQSCEDRVLAHEGSEYTDGVHPYDPGGPTRWGITIFDAKSFWKSNATPDDVRTMPKSVAQQIYKAKYWDVVSGDMLPPGIDDCVFDYGVNSGNSRAGKVLRRVLNLPDTAWQVTGSVLIECRKRDPVAIINAICDERMKFLEGLAIWPTYRKGWTTRVSEVRQFATQLANHASSPVSTPLPVPPATPVDHTPKGSNPPPNTKGVVVGGGAATTGLAGWTHLIGSHPAITLILLGVGAIAIVYIVSRIEAAYQAKQDAPTPGLIPVPPKG